MLRTPLAPAVVANIADTTLVYAWDEWDVQEYFDFPDDALEARLAQVSGRASIALTLALGEWICQRYSALSRDPAPMQYLEAAWAEQMQPGQCSYYETEDDAWRGLIRGPLSLVITIANDALFCLDEDDDTKLRAAWMANLARHVLTRPDALDVWLDEVVERLIALHPLSAHDLEDDDLGRPVARELFDTLRPFDAQSEPQHIADFLASVDPTNPFLAINAPAEDELDDSSL